MKGSSQKLRDICIYLALALATLSVYWRVGNYDFVNYDDPRYVSENPHVKAGLTWQNIKWAFSTGHASNWHPVTWLSHMLDCELFGQKPGRHHLVNLLFHLANTLLLFWFFNSATGAIWRSGFVAALFALHPLHVESVAWISERKDVLSTLFWMLTMLMYLRYVRRGSFGSYLLSLVFFGLGLMAKPMLVTL
ncbi:MAG: glycosyltransferase family 39 protein, partial [Sedimentisphaerales bacterium]|nr:glycosyltransferase family 39 protein [Sedimentisphaerales bacterium]